MKIIALLLAGLLLFTSTVLAAEPLTQTTLKLTYSQSNLSNWGGFVRVDSKVSRTGLSLRYENRSYDAAVHYRLTQSLNSYVGLFAGYSGVALSKKAYSTGFRAGVDFVMRANGFYLSGEAAYRPSLNVAGNPAAYDYRASVGYEGPRGYGLEAGYRWFIVPNTPALDFNGYVFGLTYRR